MALPHTHTHTHTHTLLSLHKIIPVFCFLCHQECWGLWSEFCQHVHRRFLSFSSVTNSQTSHSTGMFLCRIFPYVLPEDFMIQMRAVWLFSLWKCDLFSETWLQLWWGQHKWAHVTTELSLHANSAMSNNWYSNYNGTPLQYESKLEQ